VNQWSYVILILAVRFFLRHTVVFLQLNIFAKFRQGYALVPLLTITVSWWCLRCSDVWDLTLCQTLLPTLADLISSRQEKFVFLFLHHLIQFFLQRFDHLRYYLSLVGWLSLQIFLYFVYTRWSKNCTVTVVMVFGITLANVNQF